MKGILTFGFVLIVFASQSVWVTFSPIATYAARDFGVGVELVGLLAVTYPVFFLTLTIPSGLLLDRSFGRWFLFGAVATFFAAFGRLFSLNYWWMVVCQLSGAIGQPFLLNAFVPYASQLYGERRTAVISLLSLSMYLGTVFALASGVRLYDAGGIRAVILPPAIVALAGIALILLGMSRLEVKAEERRVVEMLGIVVRRRDLWIIGALLGLGVATFDNLATWLQPALSSAGLERIAGEAVAIAIVMGLIGILFIPGWVARRDARTLYLRTITPVIAVLFAALSLAVSDVLLLASMAISGLLMLPAYAIVMDWIGKFCERDVQGSATGFVGLTSRAISVALTLGAIGFIGSASLYFTYLTVPILLAFLLTLTLPRDDRLTTR